MMHVGARAVWLDAKVPTVTGLSLGVIASIQYYFKQKDECKVSEFNEATCSSITSCFFYASTSLGFAFGAAYGTIKGVNNLLGERQW